MKFIDLTGRQYGDLTVIERDILGGHNTKWRCKCACGNEATFTSAYLRSGRAQSCGCKNKSYLELHPEFDLTGQRFGRLTVKCRAENHTGRAAKWTCQCDCGNIVDVYAYSLRRGESKSCGCYSRDCQRQRLFKDLTGQVFGRWTVMYYISTENGISQWMCRCECGTEKAVSTNSLTTGNSCSCGCFAKDNNARLFKKDILHQRFGKLVVIEDAHTQRYGREVWKCKCDCGNECYYDVSSLCQGYAKSCGCVRSKGEFAIAEFLDKHNIYFEREKKFIKCVDKDPLRFDFWLPDYCMCVEFDGRQHYEDVPRWENKSSEEVQRRDAIKTKYCEENDIILLRIPYWEKQN